MPNPLSTNVTIFMAIAEDAYATVVEADRKNRERSGIGYIIRYDPEQKGFKGAIVTVVFTAMWLEALTHLLIFQRHGEEKCKKYDRKNYEEKLKLLDIHDDDLFLLVKKLRVARRELVHEKAFFDTDTLKSAQREARVAHEVMRRVKVLLLPVGSGPPTPGQK